jgi:LCP family protein required for cell wall assembly
MKRSLRDYLLTLVLAIVIFAIVAVFLIQAAEGLMTDVVEKIGSDEKEPEQVETSEPVQNEENVQNENPQAPGEVEKETEENISVTFLIMGLDYKKEKVDSAFLLGLNETKKEAVAAYFPANTLVKDEAGKYALGDLYSSRSANFFKEFIQAEVGLTPDYYITMPTSAVANMVDLWGGVSYNVPQDMQFFDEAYQMKIDLKAGQQTLNGDQAVQLLSFNGYSGKGSKEDTHQKFFRAFCSAYLVPGNLSRAPAIHNNMYYNCKTDFEAADLNEFGKVIFNLSTYKQTYTKIPGAASGNYYAISNSKAKAMFEIYQ